MDTAAGSAIRESLSTSKAWSLGINMQSHNKYMYSVYMLYI